MNLAVSAERNGGARVTGYRAGLLRLPARRVGRLILVEEPVGEAGPRARTAVCARVYGKRAAGSRAKRAAATAEATEQRGAA
jgi:predicted site-specific integrase-resolvase